MRRALESDGPELVVQSSVTVERFVFVTAYIVRKLKEADVLNRDVTESKWVVTRFPCITPPPHRAWFALSEDDGKTWRQPLEQHYDLGRANPEYVPFSKLCDYLIHHFAFAVRYHGATDEIGVFFNSDRTRTGCIASHYAPTWHSWRKSPTTGGRMGGHESRQERQPGHSPPPATVV